MSRIRFEFTESQRPSLAYPISFNPAFLGITCGLAGTSPTKHKLVPCFSQKRDDQIKTTFNYFRFPSFNTTQPSPDCPTLTELQLHWSSLWISNTLSIFLLQVYHIPHFLCLACSLAHPHVQATRSVSYFEFQLIKLLPSPPLPIIHFPGPFLFSPLYHSNL